MKASHAQGVQLEPIAVTADQTQFIEPHVQEFSRKDFENTYFNLSDFLKSISGIQIQSSGLGSPTSVSIRGSSHKQVKFIVDGHEINDSLYGDFDLNSIPLQQIESIKLIQGNSATTDHADAVGGTILVTTLSTEHKRTVVRGGIASFDVIEAGIMQPWSYFGAGNISIEYIEGKNDYEYIVTQPFNSNEFAETIEPINNNDYEKLSALLKWKNEDNGKWHSGIKLHHIEDKKSLPDFQRNRPINSAYFDSSTSSLQSYLNISISKSTTSNTKLTFTDKKETYSDLDSVFGLGPNLVHYYSDIIDLNSAISIKQSNFTYTPSLGFKQEQFRDKHPLVTNNVKCLSPTSTCDTQSNQDQISFNQKLSLFSDKQYHSLHLSLNHMKNQRKKQDLYGLEEGFKINDDFSSWSTQYNYFGLSFIEPSIIISKSIRIPTLYELFGDRGLLKSNLALKPETSHNLSLNTLVKFDHFLINQSLFYRDLENAIVGQFSSGTGTYKNLGGAKLAGWQGAISTQINQSNFELNWTIQDSLSESEVFASNKKKLPSVFHKLGNIRISSSVTNNFSISYKFHVARDMYLNTNNTAKHSGIETHSLNVKYSYQSITLSSSIENILDSRYKDQFNRPAAGRLLSMKLNYTF